MPSRPTRSNRAERSGLSHSALVARGIVRVADDFAEEYPDGDRASTEAYASVSRTGLGLVAEVERHALASFDLTQSAMTVLAVVDGAGEPITPSEISARLLVPSATVTATLDNLEDRGWIRRKANPDDRRSVLIETTAAGRTVADQILSGIRTLERRVMAGLTEAERVQLVALLEKVVAEATKVANEPPAPLEGRRNRPDRLG